MHRVSVMWRVKNTCGGPHDNRGTFASFRMLVISLEHNTLDTSILIMYSLQMKRRIIGVRHPCGRVSLRGDCARQQGSAGTAQSS